MKLDYTVNLPKKEEEEKDPNKDLRTRAAMQVTVTQGIANATPGQPAEMPVAGQQQGWGQV